MGFILLTHQQMASSGLQHTHEYQVLRSILVNNTKRNVLLHKIKLLETAILRFFLRFFEFIACFESPITGPRLAQFQSLDCVLRLKNDSSYVLHAKHVLSVAEHIFCHFLVIYQQKQEITFLNPNMLANRCFPQQKNIRFFHFSRQKRYLFRKSFFENQKCVFEPSFFSRKSVFHDYVCQDKKNMFFKN